MAPNKRKADEEAESTRMVTRGSEAAVRRQTRSSTQGSGGKSEKPVKQKVAAARKKSKKKEAEKPEQEEELKSEEEEEGEGKVEAEEVNMKTIVIERCTQCNAFKTRAEQVKASLEHLPGITVSINPVKPRRGCFEIREDGGEKFISLLDMKRPFKPMKDLNMQVVIDNIIQKIQ